MKTKQWTKWLIILGAVFVLASCHRFEGGAEFLFSSNPIEYTADSIERGHETYQLYCSACHGKTGMGNGPAAHTYTPQPADLTLIGVTTGGGTAQTIMYGDDMMPAWRTILKEDEMWDVVNYIKSIESKG